MLIEDEQVRHAREVMLNMPKAGLSQPSILKRSRSSKGPDAFKVPQLPSRTGSTDSVVTDDVFGLSRQTNSKGKGKEAVREPITDEVRHKNGGIHLQTDPPVTG